MHKQYLNEEAVSLVLLGGSAAIEDSSILANCQRKVAAKYAMKEMTKIVATTPRMPTAIMRAMNHFGRYYPVKTAT